MSITLALSSRPLVRATKIRGDVSRQSRATTMVGLDPDPAQAVSLIARPRARTRSFGRSRLAMPRISYSRKMFVFTMFGILSHRQRDLVGYVTGCCCYRAANDSSNSMVTLTAWEVVVPRRRRLLRRAGQDVGARRRVPSVNRYATLSHAAARQDPKHQPLGQALLHSPRPASRPSCTCPKRQPLGQALLPVDGRLSRHGSLESQGIAVIDASQSVSRLGKPCYSLPRGRRDRGDQVPSVNRLGKHCYHLGHLAVKPIRIHGPKRQPFGQALPRIDPRARTGSRLRVPSVNRLGKHYYSHHLFSCHYANLPQLFRTDTLNSPLSGRSLRAAI